MKAGCQRSLQIPSSSLRRWRGPEPARQPHRAERPARRRADNPWVCGGRQRAPGGCPCPPCPWPRCLVSRRRWQHQWLQHPSRGKPRLGKYSLHDPPTMGRVKGCWIKESSFKHLSKILTLYDIGWPWGKYKNILPEMLTILPESKTRVILLASRAVYSCIPRKRAIQYYYYYSYRALSVILLSYDPERPIKSACGVRACDQWNPSCEVTPFASEKWPYKRGGHMSGVKINTFMLRFTLWSGLSRGGGLSSGWPLKRGSTVEWSSLDTQILTTNRRRKSMLNDRSHKTRAIIILLPSLSQSAWCTRFYFGHLKPYMDNNKKSWCESEGGELRVVNWGWWTEGNDLRVMNRGWWTEGGELRVVRGMIRGQLYISMHQEKKYAAIFISWELHITTPLQVSYLYIHNNFRYKAFKGSQRRI